MQARKLGNAGKTVGVAAAVTGGWTEAEFKLV